MTDSRASRKGSAKLLARLERDLADVARQIATLLTKPRYEEAELAELDVRAKQLRERINVLKEPERSALDAYHDKPLVSRG